MCAMRAVGTDIPQREASRHATAIVPIAVVALLALFYAVRAHPSSSSIAVSERQLRTGFLQPLARADIPVRVLDACHYARRSPQEGWHLSMKMAATASQAAVIEALRKDTDAVIVDDREPPLVQQFPGQPNRGWNGTLTSSEAGTEISLVKNNVATSEGSIGVGWLPVCPDSPR